MIQINYQACRACNFSPIAIIEENEPVDNRTVYCPCCYGDTIGVLSTEKVDDSTPPIPQLGGLLN